MCTYEHPFGAYDKLEGQSDKEFTKDYFNKVLYEEPDMSKIPA